MFIYLGTPYTDKSPYTMELRYQAARALCADIADKGISVYSPIVHWHDVAKFHVMPVDVEFWWKQNEPFLGMCSEAWFVKLDGYEQSAGIKRELAFCEDHAVPCMSFELPELYVYLSSYSPPEGSRATNLLDSGGSPRK